MDTADPPGDEKPAADYVKGVLEREGIPVDVFALEAHRPNVVARIKGSGRKRPLLIMGHTDVVSIDPKKWTHPPFGADRDGGYIYGRGTVDDKDNLTAALMVMLLLKRATCHSIATSSSWRRPARRARRRSASSTSSTSTSAPSTPSTATPRAEASRANEAQSGSRRCRPWRRSPTASI